MKIESYTGFQPLKEVWVGGMYPENFSAAVSDQHKEIFCKISELTRQDLDRLCSKLKSLGVQVQQPDFFSVDAYLDENDNLTKPPITPRDWALTFGKTLYVIPQYQNNITGFESVITQYQKNNQQVRVLDRSLPDPMCYVVFPSVVRVGKDIFVDIPADQVKKINPVLTEWSKDYRVHVSHTGDHSDGVFCPVAPGQIFSTHYRTQYEKTFPDWEVFWLNNTTEKRKHNNCNGRWWVEGYNYQHFNDAVIKVAEAWVGNVAETVFEVNMLVIDEKNVLCIAEDEAGFKKLEQLGITPHVVDFRTRGFWDGGLHCLTVDIHRTGGKLDYWPGRGNFGIQYYD